MDTLFDGDGATSNTRSRIRELNAERRSLLVGMDVITSRRAVAVARHRRRVGRDSAEERKARATVRSRLSVVH